MTLIATYGSASASTATLVSLSDGVAVDGLHNGVPTHEGYAGTFNVEIDHQPPAVEAYCVDLTHAIGFGDTVPQVPVDYPLEVTFILNNAHPQANKIGTPLSNVKCESAAVQCAVWNYTDNFVCTGPSSPASCNVKARAAQIVAAAALGATNELPPVPQTLTLTPASATNFLPADTSHSVTAKLTDGDGAALPGFTIQLGVQSGPGKPASTSGPSPSVTLNYSNATGTPGTDTIVATVSYTIPTGQKFKASNKQGIVLAGAPQDGTLTGTATKSWVTSKCGNGIVEPGEQCDDGNQSNNDSCTNACQNKRCGDGFTQPGEQCDDGNQNNNDTCKNTCQKNVCGDQIVNIGVEECDDGNESDNDGCTNACKLPRCGDGIVQTGEECDDGNTINGDACSNTCKLAHCGDGVVQSGEQCDDGNRVNDDACSNDCHTARCGDGIVQTSNGEQCDDGNTINGDGCSNTCKLPHCGDGVVQSGEQCDDGNTINNDACSNACKSARCGDGIVQSGEQCDDGNQVNDDACSNTCKSARCGDGIVQTSRGEQCDDGNTVDTDGCNNQCKTGFCGDGIVQAANGEQCDDGNTLNGDGCSSTCKNQEICTDQKDNDGDGKIDCDDPDCSCQVVQPVCKHPCPASIIFKPGKAPDLLQFQISFDPSQPIDPSTVPGLKIGVAITNANGIVYAGQLQPGDLDQSGGRSWVFRDPSAPRGNGKRDGLFLVKLGTDLEPGNGTRGEWRLNVKAYGDLSAATLADMTLQVIVGNDVFQRAAIWTKLKDSWRVDLH